MLSTNAHPGSHTEIQSSPGSYKIDSEINHRVILIRSDALGGTSSGLSFCCLAPGQKFAKDTWNTQVCLIISAIAVANPLHSFATRTKEIANRMLMTERGKSITDETCLRRY